LLTEYRVSDCGYIQYRVVSHDDLGAQYSILVGTALKVVGAPPGSDTVRVLLYNRVNGPISIVRIPGHHGVARLLRIDQPDVVIRFAHERKPVTFSLQTGRFLGTKARATGGHSKSRQNRGGALTA
jgi:hypothetical protein